MKRVLALLLVGVLAACFAGPAQASILGSYLSADGIKDLVEDNNVGVFSGNLTAPVAGDVLQGLYRIDRIDGNNVNLQSETIWAVYSLQVTSFNAMTGVTTYGAINPAGATGNSVQELMTSLGLATPSYAYSGSMANATLFFVETGSGVNVPNYDGTSFLSTLQSVVDASWSASAVLGLVDSTDFFEVAPFPWPLPGNPPFDALYTMAYSVIADEFGAGYLPVTGTAQFSTGANGVSDFVSIRNNVIGFGSLPGGPTGWDFTGKGDFNINATPEPASLAIWALVLAGGGLALYRRKV